jgi:hypothetical protein
MNGAAVSPIAATWSARLNSAADPDQAALARLGDGTAVRYLRSILIPSDETSLHLLEAESAERVAEAFERTGLAANRVVEAVNLPAPTSVGNQRRKS